MAPPSAPTAAGSPFGANASASGSTSRSSASSTFTSSSPGMTRKISGNAFAPKRPSGLAKSFAASETNEEEEDEEVGKVNLIPSAYPRRGRRKWSDGGRSLGVAVSGTGGENLMWVRKKDGNNANEDTKLAQTTLELADKTLFTATSHVIPRILYDFYARSHEIFSDFQAMYAADRKLEGPGPTEEGVLAPPTGQLAKHIKAISRMYRGDLLKLSTSDALPQEDRATWAVVNCLFDLAEILYLPADGRGQGLIGEELLDWVNVVDPAPDNAMGNEIQQTRNPYEHPSFWPYIIRSLLRGFHVAVAEILRSLESHENATLAKIGSILANHLTTFPRSHNTQRFTVDHMFLNAHAKWLSRLQSDLAAVTGGPAAKNWLGEDEEMERTEAELRVVVDLMEGKAEQVIEQAKDWREALGAWGVLVRLDMTSDDIPAITKRILDDIPLDQNNDIQLIESRLCLGDPTTALFKMFEVNVWLAAHLGDIFDKLLLITDDEAKYEFTPRSFFLLEYAELLQSCPQHDGLWRTIADYLSCAEMEGRRRLSDHLMRTALQLEAVTQDTNGAGRGQTDGGMAIDGDEGDAAPARSSGRTTHLDEVLATCTLYGLHDERREISSIAADSLIRRWHLGVAAAYCVESGDVRGIAKVADKVIDAYIEQGAEAFFAIIDTLPSSLVNTAVHQLENMYPAADLAGAAAGVGALAQPGAFDNTAQELNFQQQMAFLRLLRDYLLFKAQDRRDQAAQRLAFILHKRLAPTDFAAVLLSESLPLLEDAAVLFDTSETYVLLTTLEEVDAGARTDPETYLGKMSAMLRATAAESVKEAEATVNGERPSKKAKTDESGGKWYDAARERMEEVRLACARHLARAMVDGLDAHTY